MKSKIKQKYEIGDLIKYRGEICVDADVNIKKDDKVIIVEIKNDTKNIYLMNILHLNSLKIGYSWSQDHFKK